MKNKILIFALKLILITVLFFFLIDTSGIISITWKEWHITTSLNIVLVGLVFVFLSFVILRWIKNKIWTLLNLSDLSRLKTFSKGLSFLEEALIQEYLGTEEQKKDLLERAKKCLPNSDLPKLLAYVQKKEILPKISTLHDHGSLKTFSKLLQYRKEQDWKSLENFFQSPPKSLLKEGWFWKEVLQYKKEINDWEGAKTALENSLRYKGVSKTDANTEKGIIYFNLGLEETNPLKQLDLLQSAYSINPDNQENVVAYAQALHRQKNTSTSKKVLIKAWGKNPSWIIAEAYSSIIDPKKSTSIQAMRDLYEKNPDNPISQQCFATALIQARLWVEAGTIIHKLPSGSQKILLKVLLKAKEKEESHIPFEDFKQFVQTLQIADAERLF
jgi:uncharacterized membrane-anchored protein